MSRDKQTEIEKIIDVLDKCTYDNELKDEMALMLYNADYRKSTDVAEEIFEEIEKSIADLEYRANTPRKTVKVEELKEQVNWVVHEVVPKILAELKKKYTEEGKCQK